MKIEAWKKHSVGGRFQYPQWKNDVFRVEKYSQWKNYVFRQEKYWASVLVSDGVVSVLNGQVSISVLVSDDEVSVSVSVSDDEAETPSLLEASLV